MLKFFNFLELFSLPHFEHLPQVTSWLIARSLLKNVPILFQLCVQTRRTMQLKKNLVYQRGLFPKQPPKFNIVQKTRLGDHKAYSGWINCPSVSLFQICKLPGASIWSVLRRIQAHFVARKKLYKAENFWVCGLSLEKMAGGQKQKLHWDN